MNRILKQFAPRIFLDIHPDHFTFRKEEVVHCIDTVMNLILPETGAVNYHSIGEKISAENARIISVRLFDSQVDLPPTIDKFGLLISFLEYGFAKCLHDGRKLTGLPALRPIVTCQGLHRLDPLLNGYQKGVFHEAVLRAGAAEVIFSD